MFYTGLLKRIIPFLVTFAAGLFIASLFIPLSFSRFGSDDRQHKRAMEFQQMQMELDQVREENLRLRAEIEAHRGWSSNFDDAEYPPIPPVPAFDGDVPAPPPAPRTPRHK